MKYSFSLLFVLLMSSIVSCSHINKVEYSNGIERVSVDKKDLVTLNDTSMWRFPQQIALVDSSLIVLDEYDNRFFHVYSINGSPLISFGNKGQGYGELLWVERFHLSADCRILYAYDDMSKKIVGYQLDSLWVGKNVFTEYKVDIRKIPYSITPTIFYDMLPLNDSLFLIKGNHPDLRYGLFNVLDKGIEPLYHSFPVEELGIDSHEEVWSLLSSSTYTCLSPDKSKMVNATYIGGIMEMFSVDTKMKEMAPMNSSFIYEPIYGLAEGAVPAYVVNNENTQFGFEDVCVTDGQIFALLHEKGDPYAPSAVVIFDWTGNVLKCIETEKRIHKICIDQERKKLYLLAFNEDNGYELDVLAL